MDADKCSIADLFQQSRRHLVPLYQRAYVWNETEQWKPLWEDIAKLVDDAVEDRAPPSHFLGAVVRARAPSSGLRLDAWLVIDGQQRLTTLQILIAALRDRVAGFAPDDEGIRDNVTELGKQLTAYTVNSGVVKQPLERHKVWPTNADRASFEAVMTCKSRAALDAKFPPQFEGKKNKKERVPDPRRPVEAYRFFDDRIAKMIENIGADDEARVAKSLEACVTALAHLMVVVIDLGDDDDAQDIFETLNFRGTPLQASDLVKNFVFNCASASKQDPEALYEEHWKHFDEERDGEKFWKTELTQGRLRRPVFDAFIEHYLQCKATSADAVASRHLYQSFKAWWETKKDRDVEHELRELRRHSETYRTFYDPTAVRASAPRLATFIERVHALDTTTVYPLLLFLLVDQQPALAAADRDSIIQDLESYLVRRAIVGTSAKNLNRAFAAMIRDFRRGDPLTPAIFHDRLRQFGGVDEWPADEPFESQWLRDPIYRRMKSRGMQMVLRALHDALVGPKQEAVTVPTDLTLEHVMPQSWEEHWPAPPKTGSADESAEARRDRLLHTLGNLTLLTSSLNPEASNRSFLEKRDAFAQSVLVLNRYFAELGTWDEEAIIARGRHLLAHAKTIWPPP